MGPKNFFDALKEEWLGPICPREARAARQRGNSKWRACIILFEGVGSQRTCSGSTPGHPYEAGTPIRSRISKGSARNSQFEFRLAFVCLESF
jgi:hypothetical protein